MSFCSKFAERAFRRPLTPEQTAIFIDRQFKDVPDLDTAVRRVVLLVLKSPRFLYRETNRGRPDGYDVASRLSFGLWDSLPDKTLLDAAASGQLATHDQVAQQAKRMIADPLARSKLRGFFLQWLKIDQGPDIVKDSKRYPEFGETVVSDLRTSLDLFLDEVIGNDKSDYRQLLRANYVFLNGRLAKLYGAKLPRRRAVPEDLARERRSRRAAFPSLSDGELCVYGHQLANSSWGLHFPQYLGPGASTTA